MIGIEGEKVSEVKRWHFLSGIARNGGAYTHRGLFEEGAAWPTEITAVTEDDEFILASDYEKLEAERNMWLETAHKAAHASGLLGGSVIPETLEGHITKRIAELEGEKKDSLLAILNAAIEERNKLEAELAEAVGLLRRYRKWQPWGADVLAPAEVDAYLATHEEKR